MDKKQAELLAQLPGFEWLEDGTLRFVLVEDDGDILCEVRFHADEMEEDWAWWIGGTPGTRIGKKAGHALLLAALRDTCERAGLRLTETIGGDWMVTDNPSPDMDGVFYRGDTPEFAVLAAKAEITKRYEDAEPND